MSDSPPESDSPSGEREAEVDTGEPKRPASTPKADGSPAPPAGQEVLISFDGDDDSWSVRIGEVFDFGEHGSFTVKERLGRGGMGEVYRADYVAPHARKFVQVFALKVLRPDARPRQERTFIDEVHLLSLLRYETIARYHTFFLDRGRQVMVMEYVEGRSLHSILELARRKGRTLSEATSLELLAQIAEALHYAHAAKDDAGRPLNLVHRDVSPTNIMVTSAGFAKLVDFGVAKADLDGRTQTRTGLAMIKGKFPYLSPELVELKPLDGRSDLFSLCSVLVEMLTGEPPFGRALHPMTLRATLLVTPKYVEHVTRGLSKNVRVVCRKALARDPAERFANGHEMAKAMLALHSYQGPTAIREEIAALEALPDATPEARADAAAALRKVKRRRRALTAIGALIALSLAGFFLWSASHLKPTAPAAPPPPAAAVPHEPPMLPTAEQGTPPVNDETKPQAPAVAKADPTVLTPIVTARSCAKVVAALGMAAAAACTHVHVKTGAMAGDCYREPVTSVQGKPFPSTVWVRLDPSNPKGECKGEEINGDFRREPCPVWEGPIVLDSFEWWPNDEKPLEKPLWFGHTSIVYREGTIFEAGREPQTRRTIGRMAALVTELKTFDGKTLPVCGVLFDLDGEEGIPILASTYFGEPVSPAWGWAEIRFFWPRPDGSGGGAEPRNTRIVRGERLAPRPRPVPAGGAAPSAGDPK